MIKVAAVLVAALLIVSAVLTSTLPSVSANNPQIERDSVTSAGAEVNGPSSLAAVSADGLIVAFASDAPDIVPNDSASRDIFVRDRSTGTTELISGGIDGGEADGPSIFPGLSADGRYVVFESQAGDIIPNDHQNFADIFVHDRQSGTVERVNLAPDGADTDDDSLLPAISSTGRYVVFTSQATNLVPTDSNHERDVFLVDRDTGETELVSIATDGMPGDVDSGGYGAGGGRVTGDGRYVVYGSFAATLVASDNNHKDDIFLRDRVNHTTERISVATDGTEGDDHSTYPAISEDGRYVVYYSSADNLVPDDVNDEADIFLRDRQTGVTTRISGGTGADEANRASRFPDISDDGRFVVYQSDANNLVPNDDNGSTDIFRYDIQTGETERISAPPAGEAHGNSTMPAVDGTGSVVAFQSLADDLVTLDDNLSGDIFAWGKPITPIATPTPHSTITPTPQSCPARRGDVNGDGHANSIDAALTLQFSAGLLHTISPEADVNHDGNTNSIDAALILQFTAGLLACLPP